MRLFRQYKYTLYGKERNIDTGIHPISIHTTRLGAIIALLGAMRNFTNLSIAG